MPYPSQTNLQQIVDKAREMIEAEGVDQLSLNKLSAALGVTTPALYRHVENRTALLRAVNAQTYHHLFEALYQALDPSARADAQLIAAARAYRDFAHRYPATYGLAFTNTIAELRPDDDEQVRNVSPLQACIARISGESDSLAALRGLLALIHGYVMLELSQQLRRGGDLDATFTQVVEAYLRGWQAHQTSP